jgi:hypothetical protein
MSIDYETLVLNPEVLQYTYNVSGNVSLESAVVTPVDTKDIFKEINQSINTYIKLKLIKAQLDTDKSVNRGLALEAHSLTNTLLTKRLCIEEFTVAPSVVNLDKVIDDLTNNMDLTMIQIASYLKELTATIESTISEITSSNFTDMMSCITDRAGILKEELMTLTPDNTIIAIDGKLIETRTTPLVELLTDDNFSKLATAIKDRSRDLVFFLTKNITLTVETITYLDLVNFYKDTLGTINQYKNQLDSNIVELRDHINLMGTTTDVNEYVLKYISKTAELLKDTLKLKSVLVEFNDFQQM